MRKFEFVREEHKVGDYPCSLPVRGTKASGGYDFYLPNDITIQPHQHTEKVFLNVKAEMPEDEILLINPRSSIGLKKIMITNTVSIIDSDYYGNPSNDGNISITFTNFGDEPVTLKAGERVVQGVFIRYGITDDDHPRKENRVGGTGSTGQF